VDSIGTLAKRVHIVGSSPRTGTTLMCELLINCFEITASERHEQSIFEKPPPDTDLFCSKNPGDVSVMPALLRIDPNLWVINMVRDPRDIVVSRHGKAPDKYWCGLRHWKTGLPAVRKARTHPRFVNVRYEDLVRRPQRVQTMLLDRVPFLRKTAEFRDYDRFSRPSAKTREALRELRPIDTRSIGAWRQHKPRVVAQIALHGSVDADLIEFGYEPDDSWHRELEGIVPDNGQSNWPERVSPWRRWRRTVSQRLWIRKYAQDIALQRHC
jgi:hypothetical protein